MELAIEEARKSSNEDDRVHPKVGIVIVKNDEIVGLAHRGETGPGDHAEFGALEKKLKDFSLVGATVYTTLEPCTTRHSPKLPCADRLIDRRVKQVIIGMLDPNPDICGRGQQCLREAGIATSLFEEDLMAQVEEMNRDFKRAHRTNVGVSNLLPSCPDQLALPSKFSRFAIRISPRPLDGLHWCGLHLFK